MASWTKKRFIRMGLLYAFLITLLAIFKPQDIDWSPSFSYDDSIPNGAQVLFEQLDEVLDGEIIVQDRPLYNTLRSDTLQNQSNQCYIIINNNFYLDALDKEELFHFLDRGNKAFISAINFGGDFLDSLQLDLEYYWSVSFNRNLMNQFNDSFNLNLDHHWIEKDSFYFEYFDVPRYFEFQTELEDPFDIKQMGSYQDGTANFIRLKVGEGELFLHSYPYAFGNYSMLNGGNHEYVSKVFSFLDADRFIWDENYKQKKLAKSGNPLALMLSHPSLRWAWMIALAGVLLMFIFYAKRKQRIIPELVPVKNDSVDFTKTIGTLYYLKSNHSNIIQKKISFFRDYIKTKFYMKDFTFDKAMESKLAMKSGHSEEFISSLFKIIQAVQFHPNATEGQLRTLSKKLNQFYKRKTADGRE